jgi:endogenous inhibitor of DNA gyrase (YacG/DUF329 family)
METTCMECGAAVPQPTTGRPRLYCSKRCRQAAFRRSRSIAKLVPVDHMETIGTAHGTLPAPAHPDDQLARAIFEARGIGAAFLRLGREARSQLAWRCERVGEAITEALHAYFEETE